MFAHKYTRSLHSSDLRDDEFHHSPEALRASAYADKTGREIIVGSLLCRVKFSAGSHKTFGPDDANLAQLVKAWHTAVAEKGRARGWVKPDPFVINLPEKFYERVAHVSLAYWIDSNCEHCNGTKVNHDRRTCPHCQGSGKAPIIASRFETGIVLDLVSELEGIFQAHSGRANSMLRRAA